MCTTHEIIEYDKPGRPVWFNDNRVTVLCRDLHEVWTKSAGVILVRRPQGERRARPKERGHVVVSMYGSPVFDEVSVLMFRYGLAP